MDSPYTATSKTQVLRNLVTNVDDLSNRLNGATIKIDELHEWKDSNVDPKLRQIKGIISFQMD